MLAVAGAIGGGLLALSLDRAAAKKSAQRMIYERAAARARATGKPLLVVGDPVAPFTLNGFFGPGYGYGDICVDINGCPGAPRGTLPVKAPIEDYLKTLPANSVVVYESEVYVYLPAEKLPGLFRDLARVSGGDLFSVNNSVISGRAYARTGRPQPVRWADVWRQKYLMGNTRRAFIEHPPHSPYYRWIEYR